MEVIRTLYANTRFGTLFPFARGFSRTWFSGVVDSLPLGRLGTNPGDKVKCPTERLKLIGGIRRFGKVQEGFDGGGWLVGGWGGPSR
jgi:hypothetical protein